MSAFAGIMTFEGVSIEISLIHKVTAAIKSCGSAYQRHWLGCSAALGQCTRSATQQHTHIKLPWHNKEHDLTVVWDGRIDNRGELIARLDRKIGNSSLVSDAELALYSYAQWKENCPIYMLGDFSFAIFNIRERKLFCACDRVGARPFYYTTQKNYFAFSSDEEALLGLPEVSYDLDEGVFANMLDPSFTDIEAGSTSLREIKQLLPSCSMSVTYDGNICISKYWQMERASVDSYKSDEECREAFFAVFSDAVRDRTRSLDSISCMLGGGLDSAAIAATIKRSQSLSDGRQYNGYSLVSSSGTGCVESQCIESIGSTTKANMRIENLQSDECLNSLRRIAWSKAHPIDNSILIPALMCKRASKDNEKVLIHGVSGDLAMHIPMRYPAYLLKQGHVLASIYECISANKNNTYLRNTSALKLLFKSLYMAYMPELIKHRVRNTFRTRKRIGLSIINPDFVDNLASKSSVKMEKAIEQGFTGDIQQDYIQSISHPVFGVSLGLRGYEHVASRFGIELRDPWSDIRVLEFFLRLPIEHKVRDGWTKYLVRTTFTNELSSKVRWRRGKEHLGASITQRIMRADRNMVYELLRENSDILEEYIKADVLKLRLEQYRAADADDCLEFMYDMATIVLWKQRLKGLSNKSSEPKLGGDSI